MSQPTCEERIDEALESTKEQIEEYLRRFEDDPFLCIDYHHDDRHGYFDAVMSYGGPSDMIRFYKHTTEYRFHDWYDGAGRDITHERWAQDLRDYFDEMGLLAFEREAQKWREYEQDQAEGNFYAQ